MNNRYLVRKEDNQRIIDNIVAAREFYKTNRTLIDQDSQAAWTIEETGSMRTRSSIGRQKTLKFIKKYERNLMLQLYFGSVNGCRCFPAGCIWID